MCLGNEQSKFLKIRFQLIFIRIFFLYTYFLTMAFRKKKDKNNYKNISIDFCINF